MAKENGNGRQYERVPIAGLKKGRQGKHHKLIAGILEEIDGLPPGSALKIPLEQVNGVSLANLRSAVHRATSTHDVSVETSSDEQNLYIWRGKKQNGNLDSSARRKSLR